MGLLYLTPCLFYPLRFYLLEGGFLTDLDVGFIIGRHLFMVFLSCYTCTSPGSLVNYDVPDVSQFL